MDYAVVLYFDKDSDSIISNLMKRISENEVNSYMLDVGIRPHITLTAFKETNLENLTECLRECAETTNCFKIKLSSVGIFPYKSSVLFLSPVVNDALLAFHEEFNEKLSKVADDFEKYYLPGEWVPHCTLATRLNSVELHKALEIASEGFNPILASVSQIGLVECNPFKEIFSFALKK